MEKGDIKLDIQQLDMHKLTNEVIASFEMQVKEKNGKISIESTAPNFVIEGDRVHLYNIIQNLIDNAIKYSHHASVITVSCQRLDGSLALSVRDTGIGIREQDIPRIFDRFYRADAARSSAKTDGYGLGLSIAKKIVTLHHGTIGVKSDIGKSTTFTVRLPYVFS